MTIASESFETDFVKTGVMYNTLRTPNCAATYHCSTARIVDYFHPGFVLMRAVFPNQRIRLIFAEIRLDPNNSSPLHQLPRK